MSKLQVRSSLEQTWEIPVNCKSSNNDKNYRMALWGSIKLILTHVMGTVLLSLLFSLESFGSQLLGVKKE